MDLRFPADSEDGQKRVHFFRKIKAVFKAMAGRQRFHNFVTAGATPSEICTSRKLDRIYHKEIVLIDGEEWIVFSISGDTLLRGQVRKLLGLALLLSLDLLPMEYLEASMNRLHVLDVPAIPGWCIYLAECRYANWEAKYPEYRIDPRREEPPVHNASMHEWNQRLHAHIVQLHRTKGDGWMGDLLQVAPVLLERYHRLRAFWYRDEEKLRTHFMEQFGSLELEASPYEIVVDPAIESSSPVAVEDTTTAAATAATTVDLSPPAVVTQELEAGDAEQAVTGKKEKRRDQGRAGRNKHKLRKGEQRPISDRASPSAGVDADGHSKSQAMILNGRSDVDAYRAKMAGLRFVRVPAERDDVPAIYREVLRLLREADRSNQWPSSSTGRQMVIETETLVENGGRGGSFSVGALPRHMPQPRGNELFPGMSTASRVPPTRLHLSNGCMTTVQT
jgi:hypothetical protein